MKVRDNQATCNIFRLLARPTITLGLVAAGLFFMGQFALFTYLRPFLETVTHVSISMLSLLLLLIGATGFVGTILIGNILKDKGLYRTLISIPILMAVVAIALVSFGGSVPITALLLCVWGLSGTSAPVGWWTWIARTMPKDAEAGGGLMVAIAQFAIMVGATVGGILFDAHGYEATFDVSALMLVFSSFVTFLAAYAGRRMQQAE